MVSTLFVFAVDTYVDAFGAPHSEAGLRGIGASGATLAQGAAHRWQVADTGVPFVPERLDFPECDAGRFGPPRVQAQRLVISNDSN